MNKVISFFVAGLKFGDYKKIPDFKSGESVILRNEPENPYDPNAIELLVRKDDHSFYKLGHVPRGDTYILHAYRVAKIPLKAILFSYNLSLPTEKSALIVVNSETILDTKKDSDIPFMNLE